MHDNAYSPMAPDTAGYCAATQAHLDHVAQAASVFKREVNEREECPPQESDDAGKELRRAY
jgi:hypothetical protein